MAKAKRPASPAMLAHLARLNADPEAMARRDARVRALRADPAFSAKITAAVSRAKADPKLYTLQNVKTGERETGTRAHLLARLGVASWAITAMLRRRAYSSRGWRLAPPEAPKPGRPPDRELLGPVKMPNPRRKMRRCLLCGREFASDSAGHRICSQHKPRSDVATYRVVR